MKCALNWIIEQETSNFSLLCTCCMHIFKLFSHHAPFLSFFLLNFVSWVIKDKKLLIFKFFIALATFPFCFPVLGPLTVDHGYKMFQSDFKNLAY
jgi:hypothetical protein